MSGCFACVIFLQNVHAVLQLAKAFILWAGEVALHIRSCAAFTEVPHGDSQHL